MRFERIISALPPCGLLAEVGCDHAKLTALALKKGKCDEAIVSDISPECLNKARRTLYMCDRVTYLVGDGVVTDGRDPDCILICGMGGHTVSGILSRYDGQATLVLSPQSHAEKVRETLIAKGYRIEIDTCFEADGKFYDLLRAVKGECVLDEMQIKYGMSYKERNPSLAKRLKRVLDKLKGDEGANADRIAEIAEVLKWQQ